jgi:hypothetical protein
LSNSVNYNCAATNNYLDVEKRNRVSGDNENIALHGLQEFVFPGGGAVQAVCTAIGNGHFTACAA